METNDHFSHIRVLTWAAVSTKPQDKYSIDDQLTLERRWCQDQRMEVVDELVVRGFSRDYWTLADVVHAASVDPEMTAFAQLQEHIRRRDFDVFLCFDVDRFGRTTSLVHEVIGRVTRDCNARVYTLFDGIWIDAENAPMIGSLKALKAQQDVDRLKRYRAQGMDNRAREGKTTTAHIALFQKRIRDERGVETAVVVDEDLRPLYTDLAALILRRVTWASMEQALFDEFGHGQHGKPYPLGTFRQLVLSPAWWGHSAIHYRAVRGRSMKTSDPWIWDEAIDPPQHVTLYRNRLPAVYSGEWAALGEQVRAELWRRYSVRGRAHPGETFRFHGLLACDECGYRLTTMRGSTSFRHVYLRCPTALDKRYREKRGIACSQHKHLRADRVETFVGLHIERLLDGDSTPIFDGTDDERMVERQLEQSRAQRARLKAQRDTLIDELSLIDADSRAAVRQTIEAKSAEIVQVEARIRQMEVGMLMTRDVRDERQRAITLLRENGGPAWLWQQPDGDIHQILSALFAGRVLVVRDGEITHTVPMAKSELLRGRNKP